MKYPQCSICQHNKTQHLNSLCAKCFVGWGWAQPSDTKNLPTPEHNYHPDNLSYIERVAKARKLI